MNSRLTLAAPARHVDDDLRAAVASARSLGLGGLELPAVSTQVDLLALSGSGKREVAHLFHTHGVALSSVRIDLGGIGPKADIDRLLDRLDKAINTAVALRCPLVSIDLGRLPPAQKPVKPKPKVTSDMAGLLILPTSSEPEPQPATPVTADPALVTHVQLVLAQLGEMADRYAAVLALSSGLSSFASLSAAVKSVPCAWFGIELDTAAVLGDEATTDEVFDDLSSLFRSVRARDAVAGDDRRTKPAPLGRGDVPWRTLLTNLDASDYTGPLILDASELPDPKSALRAGIAELKSLIG